MILCICVKVEEKKQSIIMISNEILSVCLQRQTVAEFDVKADEGYLTKIGRETALLPLCKI